MLTSGMASLRALECLVAIVDQGSLTRAAAALHTSQPTLSHQIAALERGQFVSPHLLAPRQSPPIAVSA